MHFSQPEIKSTLENFDVAKAKDPDGLGKTVELIVQITITSLQLNCNKRAFLIAWRTSELLPFFKDGDKQNVANYRFISLLSCTSKILETLVFGKILEVIKDIIAPEQYGFRKNRLSITQMITYMSEIFDNLVSTTLATMFSDFENSFDKVSHGKLLKS